jgi:hypothetical protein
VMTKDPARVLCRASFPGRLRAAMRVLCAVRRRRANGQTLIPLGLVRSSVVASHDLSNAHAVDITRYTSAAWSPFSVGRSRGQLRDGI